MDSNLNKRYVAGPVTKMREFFPEYAAGDERFSVDGEQVIYEVNLTDKELVELKKKTSIKIYTHAEIIVLINAPASSGIWYPADEPAMEAPSEP